MRVLPQQIRRQLVSVLGAWGMSDAHADTTAEMMLETDLRGVDSHGIDRKSTRLNSSHIQKSRMPSSA